MDMDSSHPNWLVFSLSNHSIFQPSFSSNPSSSAGAVVDRDDNCGGGAAPATDHQLSVIGPKLEDFLGGPGGSGGVGAVAQFEGGVNMPEMDIYDDSELKTIAASFLHNPQKQITSPPPEPPAKKAVETFGQRTSIFRGVTRHRWTGRYEAHLWDNSCRREGQSRKGRQVYLGGYDKEEKAARAYDLAALKYWGPTTTTNFLVSDYGREIAEMKHMTRQEFVASLRRRSSGFSRGASIYRGVTRHHQHGRWQARIGRVAGNKDLYLGTFSTQEEAAEAYDIAAIKFRGLNAVTNFDMSRYDVRSIASSNLPIGGATNKPKTSELVPETKSVEGPKAEHRDKELSSPASLPFPSQNSTATINFKQDHSPSLWAALGYRNLTNHSDADGGTAHFSMEFQSENEGFYNYQQHGGGTTGTATARMVSDEAVGILSNNGNWVQPAIQAAKTNLSSSFQTPIFGVE